MRKKDKLYTVNKWNRPLFAQGVDRENNNIFEIGNPLDTSGGYGPYATGYQFGNTNTNNGFGNWGMGANGGFGSSYPYPYNSSYVNSTLNSTTSQYSGGSYAIPQISAAADPTSAAQSAYQGVSSGSDSPGTVDTVGTIGKKFDWGKAGMTAAKGAAIAGNIPTKDGNLFNTMDPLHHLAGGRESGVGNAMHGVGQGLFQAGAQSGNGWLMLAGGIAQGVGSLWNGAFGAKWNKENIANVENNIANMRGTGQNIGYVANSTDLLNRWGDVNFGTDFKNSYIGKNGWFNHKATRKANKLRQQQNVARQVAMHNLTTAARHGDRNIDAIARRNTFDYGGPLEQMANNGNMGAIEYGFMSDYLKGKQDQNSVKNNMNNMFMGMPSSWFAEGGGIEIKHPGRLTELKKRTGKTEAELWAEGKPEVRKMITFARNARKWNKAYGGYLNASQNLFALGGPDDPPSGMSQIDSLKRAQVLEADKNAKMEAYKQALKDERHREVLQNQEDVASYGPLAVFPLLYRGAKKMFTGSSEEVDRARQDAIRAQREYNEFTSPQKKKAEGGYLDDTLFALGGDIQSKGADWSTGAVHVDAGGSHEENPYDGVQMGLDSEGTPNKLEEGEVVFNDYVYSTRIGLDDEARKKMHFPKKAKVSYADAARKLEAEAKERPNDPISKAALKVRMESLKEQQERQKAEMEAKRAREAFEAMSPEEQAALMQYAQQQEAAQEEAMNEQAMQEQAMAQQQGMGMSPEEQMYQEQMMAQQQGGMPMEGMMPQGYAYGGNLSAKGENLYPNGGDMKKQLMAALGLYTEGDFERWAEKNKIDIKNWDWEKALQNQAFVDALTKDNSALAHAINTGKYDFGAFVPDANGKLTFPSVTKGNWMNQTYEGWKGSEDPGWLEAVENFKKTLGDNWEDTVKGYTREQIADALRNTNAFQRGTKWLQDSEDNRLRYLREIYSNPDTPEKARKYAENYITKDADGNLVWKEGAARDYDTIFNNPSGRAANPGTYWHTPLEILRDRQVKNWVKGPNGEWELIEGDVPTGWKRLTGYNWANAENDLEYNYYERPGNAGGGMTVTLPNGKKAAVDKDGNVITEDEWIATPNYKDEKLRYMGLLGPAVGLGLWGLGVGKPNYKDLDAAIEAGNIGGALADYKPIGNYKKYQPLDLYMQEIANMGLTGANARGINNTAATSGTKQAQQLANTRMGLLANGELGVKARQYDDALNTQALDINNKVDMFNADAYNKTSLTNAELRNRNRQFRAQLGMQAAAQKMAADAAWNQGLYGNISGLFKGLGDLGLENARHNMIAEMAADGIFGVISPRTNVGRHGKFINWDRNPNYTLAAEGGKINKKKNKRRGGLTF